MALSNAKLLTLFQGVGDLLFAFTFNGQPFTFAGRSFTYGAP